MRNRRRQYVLTLLPFSEDRLLRFARLWAKVHAGSSKIPNFVLLALSGFLMNFVVTWVSSDALTT